MKESNDIEARWKCIKVAKSNSELNIKYKYLMYGAKMRWADLTLGSYVNIAIQ